MENQLAGRRGRTYLPQPMSLQAGCAAAYDPTVAKELTVSEMARLGAKARAEKLSPKRRKDISAKAARASAKARAACEHESTVKKSGVTYCVSCKRKLT